MALLTYIPKIEPEVISAGDTVEWTRQIDDFSPADYTLKYVIRNEAQIYKFTATSAQGYYQVTLTSAETAAWQPGVYWYTAYVVNATGTVQKQIATAFPKVLIRPNMAVNPNGLPTSTFAERGLVEIENTILALTTRSVESAMVNGQQYTLQNISDLFMLRERFRSEVAREQAQARLNAGLGAQNKVAVRFRPLVGAGYPPYPRVPWQ